MNFSVNIEAAFSVGPIFEQKFPRLIQRTSGAFLMVPHAIEVLKSLLKDIDWNNFDTVYGMMIILKKLQSIMENPTIKRSN